MGHLYSVCWRKKRRKDDITPTTSGSPCPQSAAMSICPGQRRPSGAFQSADIAYLFLEEGMGRVKHPARAWAEKQVSFERASSSGICVSGKVQVHLGVKAVLHICSSAMAPGQNHWFPFAPLLKQKNIWFIFNVTTVRCLFSDTMWVPSHAVLFWYYLESA